MKTRSILANIHTMEIKTENAVDVGKTLDKYVLTHPSEKETMLDAKIIHIYAW